MQTKIASLPPRRDALTQQIKRILYQTNVWKQSLITRPDLPSPTDCGWNLVDRMFVPLYLTTDNIQSKCVELQCVDVKNVATNAVQDTVPVEKEGCCALVPVLVPMLHGVKTVRKRKKIRLMRK